MKRKLGEKKTYNTRDSLVVTDPTTSLALTGLSMGERTGSRVFQWVWSYVLVLFRLATYVCCWTGLCKTKQCFVWLSGGVG
ncbi:hypothetical protein NEUTE2DRAFT_66180 [Neurospora tetrasperma FGSC 2509]|nr:hypothetical protein NEUTE2DRAFT_66180 [Neurospora tetrasperma FGSC 2509]